MRIMISVLAFVVWGDSIWYVEFDTMRVWRCRPGIGDNFQCEESNRSTSP